MIAQRAAGKMRPRKYSQRSDMYGVAMRAGVLMLQNTQSVLSLSDLMCKAERKLSMAAKIEEDIKDARKTAHCETLMLSLHEFALPFFKRWEGRIARKRKINQVHCVCKHFTVALPQMQVLRTSRIVCQLQIS